jgi:hypothetical protein
MQILSGEQQIRVIETDRTLVDLRKRLKPFKCTSLDGPNCALMKPKQKKKRPSNPNPNSEADLENTLLNYLKQEGLFDEQTGSVVFVSATDGDSASLEELIQSLSKLANAGNLEDDALQDALKKAGYQREATSLQDIATNNKIANVVNDAISPKDEAISVTHAGPELQPNMPPSTLEKGMSASTQAPQTVPIVGAVDKQSNKIEAARAMQALFDRLPASLGEKLQAVTDASEDGNVEEAQLLMLQLLAEPKLEVTMDDVQLLLDLVGLQMDGLEGLQSKLEDVFLRWLQTSQQIHNQHSGPKLELEEVLRRVFYEVEDMEHAFTLLKAAGIRDEHVVEMLEALAQLDDEITIDVSTELEQLMNELEMPITTAEDDENEY